MMDVPGIEAKYAAASGIACDILLWSMTTVAIEKLLENDLAELLLSGTFKAGDTISVRKGKAEDKLDFVKKERTANTRREAAVHGK